MGYRIRQDILERNLYCLRGIIWRYKNLSTYFLPTCDHWISVSHGECPDDTDTPKCAKDCNDGNNVNYCYDIIKSGSLIRFQVKRIWYKKFLKMILLNFIYIWLLLLYCWFIPWKTWYQNYWMGISKQRKCRINMSQKKIKNNSKK